MGWHPINLGLRFVLELSALAAMGFWGWTQGEGILRLALALGLPVIAALVWGTFRVPGEAGHSGRAPVPVPGVLRLALELAFFAFAIWALFDAGARLLSWTLGAAVLVHYVLSYDRLLWLIRR